jgi:large conductance mechanosensitive channel
MFKEFKEFAVKGNAIDLAIGVVIGTAFSGIVNSLVKDIIMPPFGLILGNVDFSNLKWTLPSGAVLGYGSFFNAIINFLIISFAIFLLVKQMNRFRKGKGNPPTTKECPYCKSSIPVAAVKCAHCTSSLS